MSRQKSFQGFYEDASVASSGLWDDREGADIIDLDQYMRGARPEPSHRSNELVVDAGGQQRLSPESVPSEASSDSRRTDRDHLVSTKRISNDSGLSDGSFARRRHRRNRQRADVTRDREVHSRQADGSLRVFRETCEQMLRQQQAQIAQVSQLCERLVAPLEPKTSPAPAAPAPRTAPASAAPAPRTAPAHRAPPAPAQPSDLDSSDLSSSSNDLPLKDHPMNDCKTYQIIMTKLDKLNKLFVARGVAGGPGVSPRPPTVQRRETSSTVCVSDKLVNTEELGSKIVGRFMTPNMKDKPQAKTLESATCSGSASPRSARLSQLKAHVLDIAPCRGNPGNVVIENVVSQCDYSDKEASLPSCRDRKGYLELEDPVNFHRKSPRSVRGPVLSAETLKRYRLGGGSCGRASGGGGGGRGSGGGSLCSLFRAYWRALRHFLATQFGENSPTC